MEFKSNNIKCMFIPVAAPVRPSVDRTDAELEAENEIK